MVVFFVVGMEEEVQQLKELVLQLKADNERLRQERAASHSAPDGAASVSSGTASGASASEVPPPVVTERLVVIPRDRRCPVFNGRSGIGVAEWIEEIQTCMRARHLSVAEQALFIIDHLEGEARDEIRFRPGVERDDPARIFSILRELYGHSLSYVTLQQAFFARQQQEGETLQEFSLALLALMESIKQCAPDGMPNSEVLLRDQFVENVLDSSLRRELKQLVRREPTASLLKVRGEAIRWEREGLPGGARGRSCSLPSAHGLQFSIQGRSAPAVVPQGPSLTELMDLLKRQQEQLNHLTHTVAALQAPRPQGRTARNSVICRRCQQPGHFARECDGERVPPRAHAHSATGLTSNPSRPALSTQQPEN